MDNTEALNDTLIGWNNLKDRLNEEQKQQIADCLDAVANSHRYKGTFEQLKPKYYHQLREIQA